MSEELALSRTNRLKLARAFRHNKRVDYGIDCVVEGQMGRALADDPDRSTAFCINVGPFWYFAGDADSPGGQTLLQDLPAYGLLMPSPPAWIAAAQAAFQDRLRSFPRYSFSPDPLSETHLAGLFDDSPYRDQVVPLETTLVARLAAQPESYLEIEAFDSPADFVARGVGFAALDGARVMGVAYSSLVCSRGIEVSVYVQERYRRQGVATALAGRLLLHCQRHGIQPNWDAANPESCKLALKLGYAFVETYDAYYWSAG